MNDTGNEKPQRKAFMLSAQNSHRFMLPRPELCGHILLATAGMENGQSQAYRNDTNGGLMLAHICPDCDTHHSLLEIHLLDGESVTNSDRYICQALGAHPYGAFLEMSEGIVHQPQELHEPSRALIADLGYDFGPIPTPTGSEIFNTMANLADALINGDITLGLDRLSGRTVVACECADCDEVHAMMLVDMPILGDMRTASGYTALGNIFTDLEAPADVKRMN